MQAKPGRQILSLQRPGCMVIKFIYKMKIKHSNHFSKYATEKVQGIVAHEFIHALGNINSWFYKIYLLLY
jgi:hypothetical protein